MEKKKIKDKTEQTQGIWNQRKMQIWYFNILFLQGKHLIILTNWRMRVSQCLTKFNIYSSVNKIKLDKHQVWLVFVVRQ